MVEITSDRWTPVARTSCRRIEVSQRQKFELFSLFENPLCIFRNLVFWNMETRAALLAEGVPTGSTITAAATTRNSRRNVRGIGSLPTDTAFYRNANTDLHRSQTEARCDAMLGALGELARRRCNRCCIRRYHK